MTKPNKTAVIYIRLTPDEKARAEAMARRRGIAVAQVIRDLIRNAKIAA